MNNFCSGEVKKYDYYRYLCCLLYPEDLRHNSLVIYAFNNEISRIRNVITEPMAGYIRLQWWREAIEEIYTYAPVEHNHPIVNELHTVVSDIDIPKELFINLIDAREADIDFSGFDDLNAIKNYAIGTSSGLFQLLLHTAEIDNHTAAEAAYHAGIAYALIGMLRSMKYNAYNRRVTLPKDLMKQCDINSHKIIEGKELEKTKPIIKAICDKAEVNLNHARSLIKNSPKLTSYILLPASIVDVFLKRTRKCDYDIFNYDLESSRLPIQFKILKSKWLGRI